MYIAPAFTLLLLCILCVEAQEELLSDVCKYGSQYAAAGANQVRFKLQNQAVTAIPLRRRVWALFEGLGISAVIAGSNVFFVHNRIIVVCTL